jgi:hypothetical protein
MELYGVHGTSRTAADAICRNKAFLFCHGRHGKGAYLWQSSKDDWEQAKELARCYLQDCPPSMDVVDTTHYLLKCSFQVDEDNFYDLESYEHKIMFKEFLNEYKKANPEVMKITDNDEIKKQMTKIYTNFFLNLEKCFEKKFDIKVYYIDAQMPKSYISNNPKSLVQTLGYTAGCYILKCNSVISKLEKERA